MTRPLTSTDVPVLARLNDAAAPAVNVLGEAFGRHASACDLSVVVDDDEGPAGFLLALGPGASYDSENYRWFSAHRPASLYVDRVVVAPRAHGRGLGRGLYEAVVQHARRHGLAEVTCEVNLDPPNPGSLAFHQRLGFTRVGEQVTKGGAVRVALLAAATDALRT